MIFCVWKCVWKYCHIWWNAVTRFVFHFFILSSCVKLCTCIRLIFTGCFFVSWKLQMFLNDMHFFVLTHGFEKMVYNDNDNGVKSGKYTFVELLRVWFLFNYGMKCLRQFCNLKKMSKQMCTTIKINTVCIVFTLLFDF